jgi:hypothetical protein
MEALPSPADACDFGDFKFPFVQLPAGTRSGVFLCFGALLRVFTQNPTSALWPTPGFSAEG